MRFFRNRRRMLRRRMRSLADDRVPMMYRYEDECCSSDSIKRHDNYISGLSTNGTFRTTDIEDVMKAVNRSHFTFNTGVRLHSRYFDRGTEPCADNDFHICFGPLREVDVVTNYAYILNALELTKGVSFLHLGSGTGYLNTMAGLLIGATGTNHGMELHEDMLSYSEERQEAFKDHCPNLQDFEYCEPIFFQGDCLKLGLETRFYDRIYCSGILPDGYDYFLRIYLKPGGVLIYPRDTKTLVKIWLGPYNRYITETEPNLSSRELRVYPFTTEKSGNLAQLPDKIFPTLQELCRATIRTRIRSNLDNRNRDVAVNAQLNILQDMAQLDQDSGDSSSESEIIDMHDGDVEVIGPLIQGNLGRFRNDPHNGLMLGEVVPVARQEQQPQDGQPGGVRMRPARVHLNFVDDRVHNVFERRLLRIPRFGRPYQADDIQRVVRPPNIRPLPERERAMLAARDLYRRDSASSSDDEIAERHQNLFLNQIEEVPNFLNQPPQQPLQQRHNMIVDARGQMHVRRRLMVAGQRARIVVGARGELYEESSEEENLMLTIARRVCRKCQMLKHDSKTRTPSVLRPDQPDEPNSLNHHINSLPLPNQIKMFLKFRNN